MKILKFLKKKRNIWIIVILILVVVGGYFIFGKGKINGSIQIGSVIRQDIQETVLATGQVVSVVDLKLSFQSGGVVRGILVKEGDKAYKGQTLAYLDQANAMATLTTARGSLAQAQANYDKLISGATQQTVQTYKDTVASATQDLDNTYNGATNTLNSAYAAMFNAYSVVTNVKNSYFLVYDEQGNRVGEARSDISANMQNVRGYLDAIKSDQDIDNAINQTIIALNNVYNNLSTVRLQCDQGNYYSSVSATDKTSLDTQKTNVNASLTSVTNLQHNIASYKIALQKAENQLSLIKAPPTQAEIDAAQAQVLSAQGQVAAAQANLNNSIIVAPASGTITLVDIKVGEQATAMQPVITLQDVSSLYAEANVSEANIASLSIDQNIDYTFDALGPDQHFSGKVTTINPASTVVSGVVNYKVKGSLENIPSIKPGMTANMTILVAKRDHVLTVPSTAVINKNGKTYVKVIDDEKNKSYHEVEVKAGLQADGGLVEIISGLEQGQKIITYMK